MTSKVELEAKIEILTDEWMRGIFRERELLKLVESLTVVGEALYEERDIARAELADADWAIDCWEETVETMTTSYDQLYSKYTEMYEAGLVQASKLDQLTNDYTDLATAVIYSFKA